MYNKTFPNWNSITTWLSNAGSLFSFCSLKETESGNFDKYSVHMCAIYVVTRVIEQAKKIGQYADAFFRSSFTAREKRRMKIRRQIPRKYM